MLTIFASFRWSMGSLLFLVAWGVLMGPMQYSKPHSVCASRNRKYLPMHRFVSRSLTTHPVQHLTSGPRLPFTGAYFGSIVLTLYFSLGVGHVPCSP